MAIRLPTEEDLHRLAAENNFELSDEELEAFEAFMPGMFSAYDVLERMPEPREPLKYRDRDPGYRPSREEDPLTPSTAAAACAARPRGNWRARDSASRTASAWQGCP